MICPNCKNAVADNAAFCGNCGAQLSGEPVFSGEIEQGPTEKIKTYLIPSIFVTLCCCIPFGIVSIIYAAKANTCIAKRDFFGAREKAGKAKIWFWIAFGVGLLINIIVTVLQIIASVSEMR